MSLQDVMYDSTWSARSVAGCLTKCLHTPKIFSTCYLRAEYR